MNEVLKEQIANKTKELEELLLKAEKTSREISIMYRNKLMLSEKEMQVAVENNNKNTYMKAIGEYSLAIAKYEAYKRITHTINDININY